MIFVVLGMHKSGTTLVSQMLHASAINMGEFDERLGYDQDNKYERHETQELNRDVLHGLLVPPLDYLMRKPLTTSHDRAGYRRNKDSVALIRQRALTKRITQDPIPPAMSALISDYEATYTDWGFKDPRTCLTYPLWRRALPDHKVIVVYRHYNQLLRRYKVTDWNLPRMYRVLHGWTHHNLASVAVAEQGDVPAIVLSYEELMRDEAEFARLEAFVGRKLTDMRNPEMYRNRARAITPLPQTARPLVPLLPIAPDALYERLEQARLGTV
ncbi:MAG: sulfotransferase [Anaerolineales bacterium]|nr:sulfotransferase [Anaerolineales bacterium]